MRFDTPMLLVLLNSNLANALPATWDNALVSSASTLPRVASQDPSIALDQLAKLTSFANKQTQDSLNVCRKPKHGLCTPSKLLVRREWGTLSKKERKAYISAVKCLQKKKAAKPSALIPGAISRFDDWVGTHINQTMAQYYSGTFLAWHRYFTWAYEQSLRTECGYTGTQPYWDWAKTAVTGLEKSPVFDGSDTSMSGNGAYIPGNELGQITLAASPGTGLPDNYLPAGYGGGCVESGPFKNISVNLGPVRLPLINGSLIISSDRFTYNPRCLTRDLTDAINRQYSNASAVVSNILDHDNIADFQLTMQGVPGSGNVGIHGGGHYSLGGDPGRDPYVSPADPVFYLHHAQIDRVWWIWQALNAKTAFGDEGISGTGTFLNAPPSANTTLDTSVNLGYAWEGVLPMRDLMSTVAGPFCYVYL
ncbi:hypothetical protein OPT61_g10091 [Boeremia exigua]|uniref:Uncharacterized protein n=1 Tax=Boeremia exigua TaxID=749465 RepID=A0ACC2HR65_9PLEO|nr:hypothetical protein OPT61_g10091 [Boeremia exigua]